MTQQQFLDSLTPEQSSAFIAIRDAIMASNSVAMKELGDMLAAANATAATHTAERDKLATTIADFLACDDAGKAKMLADAAKSAAEKERDAAQAEFDAAKAKLDAAKDALK